MNAKMNILIPCAGLGTRFASAGFIKPKPLIEVLDKTLIEYSIGSFNVDGHFIFVTRHYNDPSHNIELSALLKKLRPESTEIIIDHVTSGAAETALQAKDIINNELPLVIYNSDQLLRWNPSEFIEWVRIHDPEAAVVIFDSLDPKNSYAKINADGLVIELAEKKVISNHALVGFHYWKHGADFVKSAETLMSNFHDRGSPECYISETYNYMDIKNIRPYFIANHHYVALGTPQDVKQFIGASNEFFTDKPSTIFMDLDGTVLKHLHAISDVYTIEATILDGVREKLDAWDSFGHKIVLVTARKESARSITVKQLEKLGVPYDMLIMGVTSGRRFLINDKMELSPDRATAINVLTNAGFATIDWTCLGL